MWNTESHSFGRRKKIAHMKKLLRTGKQDFGLKHLRTHHINKRPVGCVNLLKRADGGTAPTLWTKQARWKWWKGSWLNIQTIGTGAPGGRSASCFDVYGARAHMCLVLHCPQCLSKTNTNDSLFATKNKTSLNLVQFVLERSCFLVDDKNSSGSRKKLFPSYSSILRVLKNHDRLFSPSYVF